ncbi:HAD family hydrolase [Streptomyces sp. W16]|uniref:HAD family hydrolase n=1 Tax=Streptomyces sp. W16 TaxID=3076631 RepID=UPI00295B73FE|nr:HAD family hydrolase [Streptomyces sp. W16]MDV9173169.1 HAD family hydrolase [Streptomyces sp. W16]
MPLLMLDLDNTLVDRDAAFRDAVTEFLAAHGLPEEDVAWVMSVDASGYRPRPELARALTERYGGAVSDAAVRRFLDRGAADRVTLAEPTRDALAKAVAAGWTCVIVTNGRTAQQELKIRTAGLDALVHGWVVSESAGHKKPAPEIFHAAAATVGEPLHPSWVVGDSAHADIRGATGIDARSVWVSNGRPWTESAFRPTHIAADAASAIRHVIGAPETARR